MGGGQTEEAAYWIEEGARFPMPWTTLLSWEESRGVACMVAGGGRAARLTKELGGKEGARASPAVCGCKVCVPH